MCDGSQERRAPIFADAGTRRDGASKMKQRYRSLLIPPAATLHARDRGNAHHRPSFEGLNGYPRESHDLLVLELRKVIASIAAKEE